MPDRTPLYEAQHSPRYERQRLIGKYEDTYQCRLVVLIDALFPDSVNLFEETLYDADPSQDLHVMLSTPGGDGETAIRLIRQAQAHCKELTVVVPNQAKSAGTLFILGADHIILGPTSDLGPIDPQFRLPDGSLAAGKAIIAAVEDAEQRVTRNPDTFPLHASLLSDISALMVQQARDALARTADQLTEALGCVSGRNKARIRQLASSLGDSLIGKAQSHATTVSAQDAAHFGLPVKELASSDCQWQQVWRLWAKYVAMDAVQVYEGRAASVVLTPEAYR
ncbi:MAG: serine dehydrogenase [Gammaproteobacteria bacterium]|nr:serine dehydrogenase [Gammaproteobacteria bacterium]